MPNSLMVRKTAVLCSLSIAGIALASEPLPPDLGSSLESIRALHREVLELRIDLRNARIEELVRQLHDVGAEIVDAEERYDLARRELVETDGRLGDPALSDAERAYLEATSEHLEMERARTLAPDTDRLRDRQAELEKQLRQLRKERKRLSAKLAGLQ